ncbi:type II secretory pathway, pullulanase PulA [Rubidibacter lacunae KORDI 51-2]|uniref:Type II secretory pathway, pullulanase PulA n=1 Tax=Rubidibacter lacunae KORDI 51-2 TaxID=582515 RepID=U5DRV7_9CHRO|nr:isoamylase [Rubidibacter lacunae]ERN42420.1 type II secretory pathway, pullulanase PulA [Rubidibacter lacunae KORDI 51-2]
MLTSDRFVTVAPAEPTAWATATDPLGTHFLANGTVSFAIYSRNATRVLLELYAHPTGIDAEFSCWLQCNLRDDIWRARLSGIPPGTYYAYRCWGRNWPYDPAWQRGNSRAGFRRDFNANGDRFNPNKVLFDPYTRELSHDPETPELLAAGEDGRIYQTGEGLYRGIPRREIDTGRWAAKGIVLAPDTTSFGTKPHLPPERAIVYEAHVRGLTKHPSASRLSQILALSNITGSEAIADVPPDCRGTYAGAAYMAPYLKLLGFTAIELLPVHEIPNDCNPSDRPGGNYWGYMTLAYFAPDRRYARDRSPGGPTREFKQMVKAFHDQGIEVYLDVVYNHSGEGGHPDGDPNTTGFVTLGGFDASAYYQLTNAGTLVDGATGCGNQLNFSSRAACHLVLDSLRYWLAEMGIDGFRFDLAPVLGRAPTDCRGEDWDCQRRFFPLHDLLQDIRKLGEEFDAEVIAEAWDLWGYEVGHFPPGWGEWNGRYRDAVRRFLRGDGIATQFANMVNGDYDAFADQGGPHRSLDFIVAHDGFTLLDLVSYNSKHNDAPWPFGPADGGSDTNLSWDSGGDKSLRRQQLRNFWTVLFLSRGVPMCVMGDEFGRTQNGNNNPYNIDSVATWNNYDAIATHAPTAIPTGDCGTYHDNFGTAATPPACNPLFHFARYLTHFRQLHPALQQAIYADFVLDAGEDVTYLFRAADGRSPLQEHARCVWLRIDGSEVGDRDFLVAINMHFEPVVFHVPIESETQIWVRRIDTAAWAEPECNYWQGATAVIRGSYGVHPHAIAVLEEVAP